MSWIQKRSIELSDFHRVTAFTLRPGLPHIGHVGVVLQRREEACAVVVPGQSLRAIPNAEGGVELPDCVIGRIALEKPLGHGERLVRDFLSGYEAFVQADRRSLGNAFRSSDYPDRWTVAERFAFRLDVQPVPDGKDFRVVVGEDELVAIQLNVTVRVKEAEGRARLDLFQRLAAPLSDMASKLGDTGKELTLRTTNPLVENLREILDLIPRLNITGDGKIEEFRRHALDQLASITPETLKDNDLVRSVAARKAQNILDEMSDFMGPPLNAKAA